MDRTVGPTTYFVRGTASGCRPWERGFWLEFGRGFGRDGEDKIGACTQGARERGGQTGLVGVLWFRRSGSEEEGKRDRSDGWTNQLLHAWQC